MGPDGTTTTEDASSPRRPLVIAPARIDQVGSAFRFPEGRLGAAVLRYQGDLPVLCVEGDPAEIGAAVGELAVRPAPRMSSYPDDLLRHYWASWLRPALLWAGGRMVRRLEPDYREEFEALV